MDPDRDSPLRILIVSAGVAVGCAAMVATAVTYFRPMQAAHASLERSRDILIAAGLVTNEDSVPAREIAGRFRQLTVRTLDLRTGELTDAVNPLTFDFEAAAALDSGSTPLAEDSDPAKLGRRPNLMPAYLLQKDGVLESIILPVYGQGMWSTIRGFIALGADANTIKSLVIHEHGETPGIGDRIEDPAWLGNWSGKRVFDQQGSIALHPVTRGKSPADVHAIDGISGATVTTDALVTLVRFWMGNDGYGPTLQRLREDAG